MIEETTILRGELLKSSLNRASILLSVNSERLHHKFPFDLSEYGLKKGQGKLPDEITWQGKKLLLKATFHATIVNYGGCLDELVAEKRSITIGQAKKIVKAALQKGSKGLRSDDLEVLLIPQILLLNRLNDWTLVIKVDLGKSTWAKIHTFREKVEFILGVEFVLPPFHMTIYTSQDCIGIGVKDTEQLADYIRGSWTKL